MDIRNETWVVLADARQCRLLRCGLTHRGRCHVEESDSVQNGWPGHERGRPSSLHGKTGQTYATQGHEVEEGLERFARRIVEWLEHKVEQHKIDLLFVFAPSRFLGALRRVQSPRLAERLQERKGELMHLPVPTLCEHPAIRDLLKSDHHV